MKFSKATPPVMIPPEGEQPTILLFGDSHSVAVHRAVRRRLLEGRPTPVTVLRPVKEKNGEKIGDISFKEFLGRITELRPSDVVVSMIGGSQHAVFGTVQHPIPFDFYAPGNGSPPDPSAEIIPFRALGPFFRKCLTKNVALENGGIIKGDGRRLEAMRGATRARIVHVMPPPPTYENHHIAGRHEDMFAEGIRSSGVSRPDLRLKFWLLQVSIMQKLCRDAGVEVMMPVEEAMQAGFLRPEYHQGGAHANELYGELLLRSLEAQYLLNDPAG